MSVSFHLVQEAAQKASISLILAVTEGSHWAQAAVTGRQQPSLGDWCSAPPPPPFLVRSKDKGHDTPQQTYEICKGPPDGWVTSVKGRLEFFAISEGRDD